MLWFRSIFIKCATLASAVHPVVCYSLMVLECFGVLLAAGLVAGALLSQLDQSPEG